MASIQRFGFIQYQNDLSRIFKALGHPARIAIVDYLSQNERVICKNFTNDFPISQLTISKHLQILLESGLLGYEKIVNATYYVVNPMQVDFTMNAIVDLNDHSNAKNQDFRKA